MNRHERRAGQAQAIPKAAVDRMIAVAAATTPWVLPMLHALRKGAIELVLVQRLHAPALVSLHRSTRPAIAWIGDDDDAPTGPGGWQSALPLIAWSRCVVLHAAGGEAAHYAGLVEAAQMTGRALLIETTMEHMPAWFALLEEKSTLCIVPKDGIHPVPQPAEAVH